MPRVQTLTADSIVYRYWDGLHAGQFGRFLTTQLYDDPIQALALAYGNTASNFSSFMLARGTTLLTGTVRGVGGLSGGAVQWFIGNSYWLTLIA